MSNAEHGPAEHEAAQLDSTGHEFAGHQDAGPEATAYDAVVCGAGAGGLAAARGLGGLGLRVLLVDRQRKAPRIAKGEVLQPGALRVLRRWGAEAVLDERAGVRLGRLVIRDGSGGPLMTLDYGQLPDGDRSLLAHDHNVILDALTAGLAPCVEVRRGARVEEALLDGAGRVSGVRLSQDGTACDVHAPLVVAADGIGSRLRRAADIGGNRVEYPHRLVSFEIGGTDSAPAGTAETTDATDATGTADATGTTGAAPADFSAYLSPRGLRLLYPLPGGRLRLYVQIRPDELRGLDAAGTARWARETVREVPALAPLADAVAASVRTRQLFAVARFLATRLSAPGLALVGEAAYAVHPMAAQGMNTAITSAASLTDRLAEALRTGEDPAASGTPPRLDAPTVDAALRAYEAERLPVLDRAAQTSGNAARMVTELAWPGRVLGRRAVRSMGRNPRLLHMVTRGMSGLGARPFTFLDRLQQIGLLPDPRAHRVPPA